MADSSPKTSGNSDTHQLSSNQLPHKHLLQSDALYQYILQTSVYSHEHESLKELRELTANHPWGGMAVPADEGQFLILLLKLINAKKTRNRCVYRIFSSLHSSCLVP